MTNRDRSDVEKWLSGNRRILSRRFCILRLRYMVDAVLVTKEMMTKLRDYAEECSEYLGSDVRKNEEGVTFCGVPVFIAEVVKA